MKKIISFILLILLVFILTACDSTEIDDKILEAEARVDTLESEITDLETQIADLELLVDTYITSNNLDITNLEEEVAGDASSILLLEGRVEDLEDLDTEYDDQWLIDFVAVYDEYDDQWIIDFVAAYDEYDDQWITDFVTGYNDYDDQWITDFVTAYDEYDDQWLIDYVAADIPYDDSAYIALIRDLKTNYSYEIVYPTIVDLVCPTTGTGEVITEIDGATLTCDYYTYNEYNYILESNLEVYYDSGNTKYVYNIQYNPIEEIVQREQLYYLFENGNTFYSGYIDNDNTTGVFEYGSHAYYDLRGVRTTVTMSSAQNLWIKLASYLYYGPN